MTRLPLIVTAVVFSIASLSTAATIHVPADQPTIQAGIDAAVSGDIVRVASGTWTGPENTNLSFGGRQIVLESEAGPDTCTIDCQGGSQPGIYWETDGVLVRGVTISGSSGDGMVCWTNDAEMEDCVITGHGGDGVECWGGLTLENCVITDNGGSGVRVEEGPGVTFTGCDLSDNGFRGVSAFCWSSSMITDCTFTGNTEAGIWVEDGATISGCTITYNTGGGIYLNSGGSVSESTILGNSNAGMHGGGVCSWGTVHLVNCEIIGNYAWGSAWGEGGGVWYVYGSPVISGCTISGNWAEGGGGGIATSENHLGRRPPEGAETGTRAATISGNRITGNHAPGSWGGAIYCNGYGNMTLDNNLITGNESQHAPIYHASSSIMTIRHCTIAGNETDAVVGVVYSNRGLIVENSIIWGNTTGGAQAGIANGALVISHSDAEGGQAAIYLGSGGVLEWGEGMLVADPGFTVGLDHAYYLAQAAAGQPGDSPCLDAGSATASHTCYSISGGTVCLDQLTTSSGHQRRDLGQSDLGYHHPFDPGPRPISTDLQCTPAEGTAPFTLHLAVDLTNTHDQQNRRVAARIDLDLAGGRHYTSWRSGWTNLEPLETFPVSWNQSIPLIGSLLGDNRFTLLAEDVTPAPYNQPPYLPSGGTDTSICDVTVHQP